MLAIELWVGRQFKLEVFCSNVYADDDGTTILEPVERIEYIKTCKNKYLKVQNKLCLMNMNAVTLSQDTYGMQWVLQCRTPEICHLKRVR